MTSLTKIWESLDEKYYSFYLALWNGINNFGLQLTKNKDFFI